MFGAWHSRKRPKVCKMYLARSIRRFRVPLWKSSFIKYLRLETLQKVGFFLTSLRRVVQFFSFIAIHIWIPDYLFITFWQVRNLLTFIASYFQKIWMEIVFVLDRSFVLHNEMFFFITSQKFFLAVDHEDKLARADLIKKKKK